MKNPLDITLIVPVQTHEHLWIDPDWRRHRAGGVFAYEIAKYKLEAFIGAQLSLEHLKIDNLPLPRWERRTATAVVLASALERAGLSWHVIDPGPMVLSKWREAIAGVAARSTRVFGISTTYVTSVYWMRSLCFMVRKLVPSATILVGGGLYSSSHKDFLSLDGDVFCVGAGETQIVKVVEAVLGQLPLNDIPGLYLRNDDGTISGTREPEGVNPANFPTPDWSLVDRISPPLDQGNVAHCLAVETQRGCDFRCEFCTHRKFFQRACLPPEQAATLILEAAKIPRSIVEIVDATATHPRSRWRQILAELIKAGQKAPLLCFARLSDIDETLVEQMVLAGVKSIFVGQESGDQNVLNLMRKGIKLDRVTGALSALSKHGLMAVFGFMFGFPGENAQSAQKTRRFILDLNKNCGTTPVVPLVNLSVFQAQDLADISSRTAFHGLDSCYGYNSGGVTAKKADEERLATFIAMSQDPSAPASDFFLQSAGSPYLPILLDQRSRLLFAWLKAVDRGIAIFLEEQLEGKRPNREELRKTRRDILELLPRGTRAAKMYSGLKSNIRKEALHRVKKELEWEHHKGSGVLSKILLAREVYRFSGDGFIAGASFLSGRYPSLGLRMPLDHE